LPGCESGCATCVYSPISHAAFFTTATSAVGSAWFYLPVLAIQPCSPLGQAKWGPRCVEQQARRERGACRPIVAVCPLLCSLLHQPFHQGAERRAGSEAPKAYRGHDLHQLSTNCTRPENVKGGAISKKTQPQNCDKPRHAGGRKSEIRSQKSVVRSRIETRAFDRNMRGKKNDGPCRRRLVYITPIGRVPNAFLTAF
jgi:hypothetical protein